ncbi:MAG: carboxylating nicotinate-nucleotide diphosphorylase [Planctomycetes bacterium]|nr:carboxylating nicotinate-nucleotide diphosphorylase [Planctomycetota bacterium]MCW8135101.1 carboxylating nicotinate-nucleotide diphosphorylase [Planctomycetota bacterium]
MDRILLSLADKWAEFALQEDVGRGDLTGQTLLDPARTATAELRIKRDGILAGVQWLEVVLSKLDPDAKVVFEAVDGDRLRAGTVAARVTASQTALLAGERSALNLIQRLSGIATLTGRFMDAVEGTRAMIFDTRKTTPGLRAFEKYAVRCGGGANHRMGLYDEMMIKENHLRLSGLALPDAIARLRVAYPDVRLTAEAESVEQAQSAIEAGADIVMLDDFSLEDIARVVQIRGTSDADVKKCQLEVSGGVTLDTVRSYAETGVERISVGALTHSAPALDVSLKVIE